MEALGSHQLPDGRLLRRGFTTGTCAAAAARAAAWMLINKKTIKRVKIDIPAGIQLELDVLTPESGSLFASCGIKKDAGDDPDITNGIVVMARAEYFSQEGIHLEGGEGVGRVTKPGLSLPVGASAINPVPREQIKNALEDLVSKGEGLKITISVPEGEKLAGKTLNSSLGIEGGISILGTSGIVEPMSEESIKESLVLQIPVALEEGFNSLVLTPGRRGQRQAVEVLGFPAPSVIQMSNFVGFMLSTCAGYKVKEVLLCGSLGKLSKVAGGIFHTHSKIADGRREIIAANSALEGASQETINQIMESVTAEGTAKILQEKGLERVFYRLAERASFRAEKHVQGNLKVGTIFLSYEGKVLGFDQKAQKMGGGLGCPKIFQ